MKVEKLVVNACCGRKSISFKLDRPVDQALLNVLKSNGFTEVASFAQAGLLYADNPDLIVTGPFGADRINAKCKKTDCDQILNDFEALLLRTG